MPWTRSGGRIREEAFRGSVVDGVLDSEHPDSVLGSYSITSEGDTTLCAVQRYRLEGEPGAGRGRLPSG